MRIINSTLVCVITLAAALAAQPPAQRPAGNQAPGAPSAPGAPGAPGAGARRGPIAIMTLTSTAWPDGGQIPRKHTQAGQQASPPLAWSSVPDGVASFVLVVRDLDQIAGGGLDDTLHWLVWNIPGSARALPEGVPQGPQLPDGTRQISASGPYFRGPGAPPSGPAHHYVFELYAVDGPINVPAVGQSPAETRNAVLAALAGRVRAKGVYVGLFKR